MTVSTPIHAAVFDLDGLLANNRPDGFPNGDRRRHGGIRLCNQNLECLMAGLAQQNGAQG